MTKATLTHLQTLEAESIHIMREVVAEFRNPVMLYSIGKDSSVMLHLARKAFAPGPLPFSLLHVDTGYKFKEMYEFRDWYTKEIGAKLIVHRNEEAIAQGAHPLKLGVARCCGALKTKALLDALEAGGYDAAMDGARRDEERSRAKERIFSFRDEFGQWDPKNQRPEIWNLYNGRLNPGEHMRVFPLSNWTEMDVWEYIRREKLDVPTIYFSHRRQCVRRGGQWLPVNDLLPPKPNEEVRELVVRVRTIGDIISTGMIESRADRVDEIIAEIAAARVTERGSRADDRASEAAMEDRKKAGYF